MTGPYCARCHQPSRDLEPVFDPPGETRAGPPVVWCADCRDPERSGR